MSPFVTFDPPFPGVQAFVKIGTMDRYFVELIAGVEHALVIVCSYDYLTRQEGFFSATVIKPSWRGRVSFIGSHREYRSHISRFSCCL
jgi:hypothetical protein